MLIRRGAACPSKSIRWHSDRSSPPQSVRMKWVISSSLCFTSMNTFSVMLRACVTAPLVGNCMSHALWVVRQIVISWNCYCQYDVRIFVTKVETVSYALAKLSLTSTSTWVCSNAARVYHRAGWKKIFCVSRLAVGRAKIALRVFEKKSMWWRYVRPQIEFAVVWFVRLQDLNAHATSNSLHKFSSPSNNHCQSWTQFVPGVKLHSFMEKIPRVKLHSSAEKSLENVESRWSTVDQAAVSLVGSLEVGKYCLEVWEVFWTTRTLGSWEVLIWIQNISGS